MHLLVIDLDSP